MSNNSTVLPPIKPFCIQNFDFKSVMAVRNTERVRKYLDAQISVIPKTLQERQQKLKLKPGCQYLSLVHAKIFSTYTVCERSFSVPKSRKCEVSLQTTEPAT